MIRPIQASFYSNYKKQTPKNTPSFEGLRGNDGRYGRYNNKIKDRDRYRQRRRELLDLNLGSVSAYDISHRTLRLTDSSIVSGPTIKKHVTANRQSEEYLKAKNILDGIQEDIVGSQETKKSANKAYLRALDTQKDVQDIELHLKKLASEINDKFSSHKEEVEYDDGVKVYYLNEKAYMDECDEEGNIIRRTVFADSLATVEEYNDDGSKNITILGYDSLQECYIPIRYHENYKLNTDRPNADIENKTERSSKILRFNNKGMPQQYIENYIKTSSKSNVGGQSETHINNDKELLFSYGNDDSLTYYENVEQNNYALAKDQRYGNEYYGVELHVKNDSIREYFENKTEEIQIRDGVKHYLGNSASNKGKHITLDENSNITSYMSGYRQRSNTVLWNKQTSTILWDTKVEFDSAGNPKFYSLGCNYNEPHSKIDIQGNSVEADSIVRYELTIDPTTEEILCLNEGVVYNSGKCISIDKKTEFSD